MEKPTNTQQSQQKSFEEREREYLEARKRILGSDSTSISSVSSPTSESKTINDQKAILKRTNNSNSSNNSKNSSNNSANSRSSNQKSKNNFSHNENKQ